MIIEKYLLENKEGDRLDYRVYAITDTNLKIPMDFITDVKFELDVSNVLTKLTFSTHSVEMNLKNVKSEIPMEFFNQSREEVRCE